MATSRADGSPQTDLAATFDHTHDHDVGDTDAADDESDHAKPEKGTV